MEYRLYLTTVQSKNDAKIIASELLKYRVIACVNIVEKMTSMYVWNNRICEDNECLMIIKSKEEYSEKIKKIVTTMHKYDLPEFIEIPITNGSKDYLDWIDESLKW